MLRYRNLCVTQNGISLLHQNFAIKPQMQITKLAKNKHKMQIKYYNYTFLIIRQYIT